MSDLTPTQFQERSAERIAERAKLREAYQRIYNNPFRYKYTVADPALFRYEAARAYAREFYKFTPRSIAMPAALLGFTVWLQFYLNDERRTKENAIRTGQKTYFERALWSARFNA